MILSKIGHRMSNFGLDTTLNLAYFDVMTARYSMIQNGLLLLALNLHREG